MHHALNFDPLGLCLLPQTLEPYLYVFFHALACTTCRVPQSRACAMRIILKNTCQHFKLCAVNNTWPLCEWRGAHMFSVAQSQCSFPDTEAGIEPLKGSDYMIQVGTIFAFPEFIVSF